MADGLAVGRNCGLMIEDDLKYIWHAMAIFGGWRWQFMADGGQSGGRLALSPLAASWTGEVERWRGGEVLACIGGHKCLPRVAEGAEGGCSQ